MTSRIDTLLVLGAGGDLTQRLLLPGLAGLLAGDRGRPLQLIGVGREEMTDRAWKDRVRGAFADHRGKLVTRAVKETRWITADVTDPAALAEVLAAAEGTPALYFALPPAVSVKVCEALREIDRPAGLALVLEKPFGTDLASARRLNALLADVVPEQQVHRVDHFLGRSDVLNLLGTRFANRTVESLLSNQHVERIEIVYDETLTLEGRAGYYDRAGALVDMIQSHLLHVMALLMMEAPATLHERDLRDAAGQLLRATHLWPGESSRRARYTAGTIAEPSGGSRSVPAYTREPGVDPRNRTETLAEITVEVRNWRWNGVPVTLRSGKALGEATKQAVVTFRQVPHLPAGLEGSDEPDQLVIGFKPPRLALRLDVNGPGDPLVLDRVELATDLGPGDLEAYGEVLDGVLDGDPTLSVRGDNAEECWRIVEPVLAAWRADEVPMETYPAGSQGPWRTK